MDLNTAVFVAGNSNVLTRDVVDAIVAMAAVVVVDWCVENLVAVAMAVVVVLLTVVATADIVSIVLFSM